MNPELTLEMQVQILQVENAELKAQLKAIGDILNPEPKPRDSTVGVLNGANDSAPPLTSRVVPPQ